MNQVVTNSTCLITLERIGRLEILKNTFNNIFAPMAVHKEIGFELDWLIIKPVTNIKLVSALLTQLDVGEAQAIALSMEFGEFPIILDDKKARRIAQQIGLKVIGTVGFLLKAKQIGIIGEIKPFLDAINDVGFYITDSLYKEALRISGE